MANVMWDKLQRFLDRTESRLALYYAIGGTSATGIFTAWVASYSNWVSQFGVIGWWMTGLAGSLAMSIIILCGYLIKLAAVRSKAVKGWTERVNTFNPLDTNFFRLRMKLLEMADPVTGRIRGKSYTDCDLLGPGIILFYGKCNLTNLGFFGCDVFILKPSVFIQNVIVMEDVNITGGRISGATILIGDEMVATFEAMGVEPVTYSKPH
ncbi:hypothetical protein [Phyllobacterium endophyticum]|uniref:hypothetical protein n=1 Tax=Phyllobacterium endophyticum TaxID=1149773 RepID=UPI0011CC4DC2|nr:hypothetical protein [Phyllobacterium endophyticum]TXR48535.1 hypothetical protein FVA77_14430 [Phyllobacterium endophyticum]